MSPGIREQANETFQNKNTTSESRLTGYFYSEIIFVLSHGVLTDVKIKVTKKDDWISLYNVRWMS